MSERGVSKGVRRILERYGIPPSATWLEDSGYRERERWRELGRRDLYFLSTVILGYSRFSTEPMQGYWGRSGLSHSEEMCNILSGDWGGKSRLLLLRPRKHFKTTTLEAYCIQEMLRRPTVTILVVGATMKNQARPFLQNVKHQIETNEVLRGLYPELRPMKGHWSGDSITIQREGQIAEPTLKATGLDSEVERWHGDLIIKDDIVTYDNSKTRDRQLSVIAWAKSLSPMLNDWGREIVAGTRYADYDYYAVLMTEEAELWETTVRPAVYDAEGFPTLDFENGFFLFPEEWNARRLHEQLIALGPESFSCQYLNEPVPRELQEIHQSWIDSSFALPPEGLECTYYVGMDPTAGTGTDNSAIAVVGVDSSGTCWVKEVVGGKWSTRENVERFLDILDEHKPAHSLFEAIGVGAAMEQLVQEEMEARGTFHSVEFVKHWDRNLTELVRSVIIPRMEAGKIKLSPHLKNSRLVHQMLRFPRARNDDELAALTMAIFTAAQWGHTVWNQEEAPSPEPDPYANFPTTDDLEIAEWTEHVGRVWRPAY